MCGVVSCAFYIFFYVKKMRSAITSELFIIHVAINVIFSTLHTCTTPFLYGTIHFGVPNLKRFDYTPAECYGGFEPTAILPRSLC